MIAWRQSHDFRARKSSHTRHLLGAILALVAWPAHALDMEFYTYDGFDEVVTSLQRLALIFSDNGYLALFSGIAIIAIVLTWFLTAGRGIAGAKAHPFAWTMPILAGLVIYKALVIPTGTLWVYDPVRNQNQAVGGIPDIVVAAAGLFNTIQRGLVDIVDTASAYPYANEAGGIRFDLIYRATSEPLNADDSYLSKSVSQYVVDCLPIALAQPAFAVDLNTLKHQAEDLKDAIGAAQNDAAFTTWYDNANKGGVSMTCRQAWVNKLNPALSDANTFASMIKGVCGKAGFNINDAQQMAQCQVLLDDVAVNNHDIAGGTAALYIRNVYITQQITRAMESSDPDLAQNMIANRNMMLGGFGAAQAANEWIPHAMAVATAVAFGIIPVTVLFLVTPLCGKALVATFSMLIGVSVWGITDAIVHQMAMDAAQNAYDKIKVMKLGIDAILLSPDAALQSLAYFGQVRSMGMALAMFVMGTVFVMGNKALSSMGGMVNQAEGAGSSAAKQVGASEERATLLDGLSNSRAWDTAIAGPGVDSVAGATGMTRSAQGYQYNHTTALGKRAGWSEGDIAHSNGMMAAGANIGEIRATHQAATMSNQSMAAVSMQYSQVSRTRQISDSKGYEEGVLKMGGWDGKSSLSESERAEKLHAGAMHFSSIEAMHNLSGTEGIGNVKDHLKAVYEEANPGKTLTDAQAWGQVAKYSNSEAFSSIDATKGDANQLISFLERNKSLGMARIEGLFEQAAAFGISPQTLASVDGKMEAARQTGDYRALQKMSANEVAASHMVDRMYQGERADALQDLAGKYNGGDVKALLSNITNTDAAANLGQYLAMSKMAGTLKQDMVSTFMSKDMAGVSMSMSAQDVRRNEKALSAVMSPEQLAHMKEHGGQFGVTFNPRSGEITHVNASTGSDVRSSQSTTVDTSTSKAGGTNYQDGFNASAGAVQEALASSNTGLLRSMMADALGSPANEAQFLNSVVSSRYAPLVSNRQTFNEGTNEQTVEGSRRTLSGGGTLGGGAGLGMGANKAGISANVGVSGNEYSGHDTTQSHSQNNDLQLDVIRGYIGDGWDRMKQDAAREARSLAGDNEAKYNELYIGLMAEKFRDADHQFYGTINSMSEGQAYRDDANLGKPFYR